MTCINEICYVCNRKMPKEQRDKFADGYPFGHHDECVQRQSKKLTDTQLNNWRKVLPAIMPVHSNKVTTDEDIQKFRDLLQDMVNKEYPNK